MNKTWLVAKETYRREVKNWSFLLMIFAPFLVLLISFFFGMSSSSAFDSDTKVGIVSQNQGIVQPLKKTEDFDGYKNMVGAFKMPRLVYMNIDVLHTLDDRQYYAGFAEIMKHGLIKNASFYEWLIENMYEICDREPETIKKMLYQSNEIKKLVVEKDPTEQGDRALLNFGHTIGHAIEKASDFKLLHGECVALGCVAAAFISWKKEYLSMEEYYEVRDMFVPFNLPISMDNIAPETILKYTKSDKKMVQGKCKFVLLKKIGKAFICTDVTDQEILDAVNELIFKDED